MALEKQLDAAKVDMSRKENEMEAVRDGELGRASRGVNSSDIEGLVNGGVLRMMNSHLSFKNAYLGFLAHLRGLAGSPPYTPASTSLLTLPSWLGLPWKICQYQFLSSRPHYLSSIIYVHYREPTLHLDLAPSLD
jgi:hypothetical protein